MRVGWGEHRLLDSVGIERGVEVYVGSALDHRLGLRLPLVVEREAGLDHRQQPVRTPVAIE